MKFKNIALGMAGLLLFTIACSEQPKGEVPTPEVKQVTMQVHSEVDGLRVTEANLWESSDAIGVYAPSLNAANVQYTTTSTTASADFTTTSPIMIAEGSGNHEAKAYYPYSAAIGSDQLLSLQLPLSKPLLYANGSVSYTAPRLALNFKHQLAQIQFTVKGAEVNLATAGSIMLKGVHNSATFNVTTAALAVGTTTSDLTLTSGALGADKSFVARAYLLPGEEIAGKTFVVSVDGNSFTGKLTAGTTTNSIEAGKRYAYTLNLKPAGTTPSDEETEIGGSLIKGMEEEVIGGEIVLIPDETVTPTPPTPPLPPVAGESALFLGDLNSYVSTPDKQKVTYTIDNSGRNGNQAIVVDHASTANNQNWRTTLPALTGTPKSISFYIKGSASSGKTIVLRVAKGDTNTFDNFGYKVDAGSVTQPIVETSYSFTGGFDFTDWTKISFDLTTHAELPTTEGSVFFEVRHGKGGIFNYSVCDFEVTY